MRRGTLVDCLVLLFFTSLLILPLFRLEYTDNWRSIESTFIADARMLSEHLPHPGWQPLWYAGTRTDYIYPPALRYGTTVISKLGGVSPARAYHLYTAVFYIFGIVAVYWLVRAGSGSRPSALFASVAAALVSPSFLLLSIMRHDSGHWIPQRLHVLMTYAEGPHISAFSVLPAALAASFLALRQWRPAALAAAGALCALVVANNFYGATALAIFYPIVVWSVWTGERTRGVWLRAAAIPLIVYGLSALWLTPSYLRITVTDLKWVALPGNSWSRIVAVAVAALYCFGAWRYGRGRPEREWTLFVAGSALALSLYVLGFYYLGFQVTGDAMRLVPELDLALILAAGEVVRRLWNRPGWRIPAALIVLVTFASAPRYLRHVWFEFPPAAPLASVYEYRITKWVHDNLPGQRVLPSGTVRFWFDAWFDNAQPDGGSLQGMLNQNIPTAVWQIMEGDRPELSIRWLQALGTDAVIVPDKTSLNHYHDYHFPEKFRGAAPVLFDDGHGTVIYRIPRRPGIARIVDQAALARAGAPRAGDDLAALTSYVEAVEDPRQSEATLSWRGFEEADVTAKVKAGQTLLVQETWDPSWRAQEGGVQLPIRVDPAMGFMLIDVPEGDHTIHMRFATPLENRVGEGLFLATLLAMAVLLARGTKRPV